MGAWINTRGHGLDEMSDQRIDHLSQDTAYSVGSCLGEVLRARRDGAVAREEAWYEEYCRAVATHIHVMNEAVVRGVPYYGDREMAKELYFPTDWAAAWRDWAGAAR